MQNDSNDWSHCLEHAAISDVGMRRANNQDSLAVALAAGQEVFLKRGHLFLVADGMGAHAAGELASKLAADNVPLTYTKANLDLPASQALVRAVEYANDLIHRRGLSNEDFRGMGTTNTALALLPEGALVAHVGDSRAYRLRGATFEQLTFDHSLVWEMRAAGQLPDDSSAAFVPKNIITRSLGPNPAVQVDLEGPFPLQLGDTFLLCSDGLSGQVADKEIGIILSCFPPKKAIRLLVDLANLRGGPDNITIVVCRVLGPQVAADAAPEPTGDESTTNRCQVHPAVWTALGVFALLALAMGATQQWILAGVGVLGGVVAAIIAMMQQRGGQAPANSVAQQHFGRGPYIRYDCTVDPEFVSSLARTVAELREAATTAGWTIDWTQFAQFQNQGTAAATAGNLVQAVREYGEAVMDIMAQLRSQAGRRNGPGTTS